MHSFMWSCCHALEADKRHLRIHQICQETIFQLCYRTTQPYSIYSHEQTCSQRNRTQNLHVSNFTDRTNQSNRVRTRELIRYYWLTATVKLTLHLSSCCFSAAVNSNPIFILVPGRFLSSSSHNAILWELVLSYILMYEKCFINKVWLIDLVFDDFGDKNN